MCRHRLDLSNKLGRSCIYFVCKNADALNVLKEHIDSSGLNMEAISLPFWAGDEGEVMLRVGAQNSSLTKDQLAESRLGSIRVPVDFKFYSGKTKSGCSIHV